MSVSGNPGSTAYDVSCQEVSLDLTDSEIYKEGIDCYTADMIKLYRNNTASMMQRRQYEIHKDEYLESNLQMETDMQLMNKKSNRCLDWSMM